MGHLERTDKVEDRIVARLNVSWRMDGMACALPGPGHLGPMVLLVLAAMLVFVGLVAGTVGAAVGLALVPVSIAWSFLSLRPRRLVLRRDRLVLHGPYEWMRREVDLRAVDTVRLHGSEVLLIGSQRTLRIQSSAPRWALLWLAERIGEAVVSTREDRAVLGGSDTRAARGALDDLRRHGPSEGS